MSNTEKLLLGRWEGWARPGKQWNAAKSLLYTILIALVAGAAWQYGGRALGAFAVATGIISIGLCQLAFFRYLILKAECFEEIGTAQVLLGMRLGGESDVALSVLQRTAKERILDKVVQREKYRTRFVEGEELNMVRVRSFNHLNHDVKQFCLAFGRFMLVQKFDTQDRWWIDYVDMIYQEHLQKNERLAIECAGK